MRKLITIVIVIFFCTIHSKADITFRKDSISPEAVSLQNNVFHELKNNKQFNYYTVNVPPNWWKKWQERIHNWLKEHFDGELTMGQTNAIMYSFLALIIALIIFFLVKYKPSLFYLNKKRKAYDYTIEDEDINGKNFELLTQQALDKQEYTEAIRWTYLRILQTLNDKGYISFDTNKTANEYVYELKKTELIPDFRILTNRFIYYRYGNGIVDADTCREYMESALKIFQLK